MFELAVADAVFNIVELQLRAPIFSTVPSEATWAPLSC